MAVTPKATTFSDRWDAFLNHLFSWEGALTILTILGITIDGLKQYGNLPPWTIGLIAGLTMVYTIGAKIAAAFGHGALTQVLQMKGKI